MAVARLLRPLVLSLTALFPLFHLSDSITDSESLLKFKQSLTNTKSLDSWRPNSEPCGGNSRWVGLICHRNVVFGLQLERMGLSGHIDILSLTELPSLRTISIMNNSFLGTIPEFNWLSRLKSMYLSGNRFSGVIPPTYFSKMVSLKKVWLSNNEFMGPVPLSLATELPNLMELHLENNKFSGVIPNFSQPTLVRVDFSNNDLVGEIPPGLLKFDMGFFAGNLGLCGPKLGTICAKPKDSGAEIVIDGPLRNATKTKYIIAFGTLAGLLIFILAFLILQRKRKKKNPDSGHAQNIADQQENATVQVTVATPARRGTGKLRSSRKDGTGGSSRKGATELVIVNNAKGIFGLTDLMKASAEILVGSSGGSSSGKVGSTYKAVMANGVAVVVKRVTVMNQVGREVFDEEIRRLGSLRHKNLLTPLAYHFRRDEKLLVYEFVANRSLLYRLHGDEAKDFRLDWPVRLKIVQGMATGMAFLHRELGFLSLPHGNLKSSNILLADDGEPLLSEFGFQPLINADAQFQSLVAYRSPEADRNGIVTAKSDVFSVGVVILEILTGKFPSQYAGPGRAGAVDMVEWVRSAVKNGGWMELLDPTVAVAVENSSGEIEKILQIGVVCTSDDPEQRPDMNEVVDRITSVRSKEKLSTMQVLPSLRDGYADTSIKIDHHQESSSSSSSPSRRRDPRSSFDGDGFTFAVA